MCVCVSCITCPTLPWLCRLEVRDLVGSTLKPGLFKAYAYGGGVRWNGVNWGGVKLSGVDRSIRQLVTFHPCEYHSHMGQPAHMHAGIYITVSWSWSQSWSQSACSLDQTCRSRKNCIHKPPSLLLPPLQTHCSCCSRFTDSCQVQWSVWLSESTPSGGVASCMRA